MEYTECSEDSEVNRVIGVAKSCGRGHRDALVGRKEGYVHWCWADGEFADQVKQEDEEVWFVGAGGDVERIK